MHRKHGFIHLVYCIQNHTLFTTAAATSQIWIRILILFLVSLTPYEKQIWRKSLTQSIHWCCERHRSDRRNGLVASGETAHHCPCSAHHKSGTGDGHGKTGYLHHQYDDVLQGPSDCKICAQKGISAHIKLYSKIFHIQYGHQATLTNVSLSVTVKQTDINDNIDAYTETQNNLMN